MYTNITPTETQITETIIHRQRTFIPWRTTGNFALQQIGERIRRRFAHVVTEIVDEPQYGWNFDVPHQRHLVDQGFNNVTNEHLESVHHTIHGQFWSKHQMDDADFRERCVVQNGALAVLHLKSKSQLQPKTWLRAEYLAEKLALPVDLCVHLANAFKKLSVTTWKVALRLLNGAISDGKGIRDQYGDVTPGCEAGTVLATGIKHAADPIAAAQRIIDLAAALELPMYDTDEPDASDPVTHIDKMYADSMTYGVEIVGGYFETDTDDMADDDTPDPLEEPPVDDSLDAPGTDNPYSSHRLADGTDSLPLALDYQISFASYAELKQLAAGMHRSRRTGGSDPEFEFSDEQRAYYRQKVGLTDSEIDVAEAYIRDPKTVPRGVRVPYEIISRTGIKVPKKYWFFSKDQTSHFWALYNARKAQLEHEALEDPNFARVTVFIAQASKKEAAAAIYAYRDGKSFDLYGIETIVDGEQVVSKATMQALWTGFQARFAR